MSIEESFNPLKKAKILKFYDRKQIASEILDARAVERGHSERRYNVNRGAEEAEIAAGGLKYFFDYVKSLPSNVVLDIGAGTGRTAKELKDMPMAEGIDLHVTCLTQNERLQQNISKENIHITSAETLRGIEPNSLGGVISIIALEYSAIPAMAIKKIDESLVAGGVVKIVFLGPRHKGQAVGLKPDSKDSGVFNMEFRKLGYDVEEINQRFANISIARDGAYINTVVILAIKPGNPNAPKAEDLMKSDLKERDKRAVSDVYGVKVFDVKISRPGE